MTLEELTTLATFGSVWAMLAVGHNLADHVSGQSDHRGKKAADRLAAAFPNAVMVHTPVHASW
ncbi:hypothetical protein ACFU76_32505 [Streptomyces sp. NPDC057539]|uniref:hypothetical protein n=1 Tax=Streptomyces sp. NPDC057539 TaxID=3346159 RepID=UPI0036D087D7